MGHMFDRYDDPNYKNIANNTTIEDTCISDIKDVIFRGTTSVHSFTIPLNMKDIEDVVIVYVQGVTTVLTKKKSDTKDPNPIKIIDEEEDDNKCTLTIDLTRENTLAFKPTYSVDPVKIQLTIYQLSDSENTKQNVITSDIYRMRVEDTLYESPVMPNSEK